MEKLCECGCGEKTRVSHKTEKTKGWVKGEPRRFCLGHNIAGKKKADHPQWRGGKTTSNGYVMDQAPLHPRARSQGYVRQNILVAEKALGKLLPSGAVVHHVNGQITDNRNENLVICQDQAYHILLHQRARALIACGHAKWLKCPYCKQYDAPENMYVHLDNPNRHYHRHCRKNHRSEQRWLNYLSA